LPPTVLRGREGDLKALRHWIADPTARLITLTGPGGTGKTRLALELAHAIAAEGAARVVFVPLADIRHPALVAAAIGEALGLSGVTVRELPKRAHVACDHPATWLVLDNLEQVLDAASLIADLLSSAGSVRLLATSRAPLHLRGEREYTVGPLGLDVPLDATSPADLVRHPAVRLFVERVRDAQPSFRLTSANGRIVAAICRRLDGLPLALELAASWMRVVTAEDLLWRLAHDVLPSTDGPRDLPARQQTMDATVAWSYQLLAPDEQRAFRRFGALPSPFPVEAAAAVLAGRDGNAADDREALRATAGLIDKSLLMRANSSATTTRPFFRMLETVRVYAGRELVAACERDDAVQGLMRYCTREISP
jgi:predicted ATPase